MVWDGIQRLDVVSISLDANQDNPQLIFESMNSTGKGLSSADLIRNFILMVLPKEEQDSLYLNHWRNIELTLGEDTYEDTFDEFLRNYLTVRSRWSKETSTTSSRGMCPIEATTRTSASWICSRRWSVSRTIMRA